MSAKTHASKNTPAKRFKAFTRRTGYALASHVYPGGYFVVTKEVAGKRVWRVARFTHKWTFEVGSRDATLHTQGFMLLQRELVAQGVSPKTQPSRLIADKTIPRWPTTILD